MNKKKSMCMIASIILLFDQLIKIFLNKTFVLYQEIKIIPGFFKIFLVKNTGAAFSILQDNTIFIIIITVCFLSFLYNYVRKEESFSNLLTLALGMIFGGVLGNLVDSLVYHGVIDYLSFSFGSFEFPIFNLADISIVFGAFLIIYELLFSKNKI